MKLSKEGGYSDRAQHDSKRDGDDGDVSIRAFLPGRLTVAEGTLAKRKVLPNRDLA
jgi:hypothetical protein